VSARFHEPKPAIVEGQTRTEDVRWQADVCIVGSGAGGAVTAALLQQAGLKVVILEEGGYFTANRFRMLEKEAYRDLYQDGTLRSTRDGSLTVLQGKAVGGTTVVNWTTSFRTPAHVLAHWQDQYNTGGLDRSELDPHFDTIESRLNIERVPLAQANRNNRLLYDGCRALGIEVETIARNVAGCIHTGYCGLGCPVDAKQSMLVTYVPEAVRAGATLLSRCRVIRLAHNDGRVQEVRGELLDASGRTPIGPTVRVRAKHVVVAGGAINSPALLLRSHVPDPHDLLGRRTFFHPVVLSVGMHAEQVDAYYGAPQTVASHAFAERGDEIGFLLEAAPGQPGLTATALPGMGSAHEQLLKQLPHLSIHLALTADGLHADVAGATVRIDGDGQAVFQYPFRARHWRAFREAQHAMARIQLAAGAQVVYTLHDPPVRITSEADLRKLADAPYAPGRLPIFSAHVMGGCGMSNDAKRGVVRAEDLRHHQLRNLHVIDGSVFPSGLGVNPQETIYGLAHRTASRLAAAWT